MRTEDELLSDPKLAAAVDELKRLMSAQYPTTTYAVAAGEDPDGLYVTATVDLDDPDAVLDVIGDRLLELEVDEGLPVYVVPVRTPERVAKLLAETAHNQRHSPKRQRP
jgi:hypothetical protein